MRLACAHAKLMFRHIVVLQDSVVAIACVASSQAQMQAHTSLSSSGTSWSNLGLGSNNSTRGQTFLHYDFSLQPDEDYLRLESQVLQALNCTRNSLGVVSDKEKRSKDNTSLFRPDESFTNALSNNTDSCCPSLRNQKNAETEFIERGYQRERGEGDRALGGI